MPAWASGRRNRVQSSGWRGWLQGLPGIVAMLALFAGAAYLAARLDPLPPRFSGTATVSDGDTLRLGSDRIRLLGIDAPELDQVCWRGDGAQWPCGADARRALVALVASRNTACQPTGRDKYGRTLATCMAGGDDLGKTMVRDGLAISYPDYRAEEASARIGRRGLWQGRFTDPRDWRDDGPSGDPGPNLIESLWNWFRELTGARTLR